MYSRYRLPWYLVSSAVCPGQKLQEGLREQLKTDRSMSLSVDTEVALEIDLVRVLTKISMTSHSFFHFSVILVSSLSALSRYMPYKASDLSTGFVSSVPGGWGGFEGPGGYAIYTCDKKTLLSKGDLLGVVVAI
jgi:hypothetical protein